jgi:hypothetical protein
VIKILSQADPRVSIKSPTSVTASVLKAFFNSYLKYLLAHVREGSK